MSGEATRADRRVAMIGPVLPFRGGIAQHTTRLHRALSDLADLQTLSFTRMYPRMIFPGAGDRDPGYEGHREPGVSYEIDSLNPLTWRRAVTRIAAGHPEFVIIPWWTVFWAPCFGYMASALRRRGVPVAFFCHNVVEHDARRVNKALTRAVLRQGSWFLAHTREDEANLRAMLPDARVAVRPHPIYDQFPPARHELARRVGLELLFFGFVRPYKGLDVLIEAMGLLAGEDVMLTVAGEAWHGLDETVARVRELGVERQVEFVTRYLDDAEVAEYFDRADVVVLPYRSATGTGVVPVAYHYGRPVIVTRVGGLPDVVRDGETGYIVPSGSPAELADAVRRFYPHRGEPMRAAIERLKATMGWDAMAEEILSASERWSR